MPSYSLVFLGLLCLLVVVALVVVLFVVLLVLPRPRHRAAEPGWAAPTARRGRCPECGAELSADAPEGLCPRCLLRGAISSAHDAARSSPGQATDVYSGPATAPAIAELAPLLPQLEILELIGQGGMGAVYKARQSSLDRLVAVKVLPREAGQGPAFAERFTREARALARLGHPNIVAVHDVGKAGDFYYFVMEYVEGVNLRQVLRAGQLSPQQALQIVPQLCDALAYAHEEGIVHRDIKPENILLDRKGRVKIADFGLAKLLGRDTGNFTLTGSRQIMGTLYYMAPEQVERPQEVDHRADIYSLGVVFYEMLTGQLPVGRFPLPSEKGGSDAILDRVVLRALEREPERRYQHASEVKTDVEAHATRPPVPARATHIISRTDADVRAAWTAGLIGLIVPLVVVALAIAGTIVAVLYHAPGQNIVPALIAGWSIAAVIAVVVIVRSLHVIRQLPLPIENLAARASAARAAGLIGLIVPLVVVFLAIAATTVTVLNPRPNEDITIPLVVAWAIAAAVVLVAIVASLEAIRHLHRPTGDAAPPSPGQAGPADWAAARVRGPALGLLLVGGLHIAMLPASVLLGLVQFGGSGPRALSSRGAVPGPFASAARPDIAPLFAQGQAPANPPLWNRLGLVPFLLLGALLGTFILIGAVQMLRLRSHASAMTASILALLPFGPAWLIGLPVGSWALAVLTAPDVKTGFGRRGARGG